jgi:hypothetical protein
LESRTFLIDNLNFQVDILNLLIGNFIFPVGNWHPLPATAKVPAYAQVEAGCFW